MIKDQQFPEPSLTKTELNQLLGDGKVMNWVQWAG
jgi:hypothetical protein